MLMKIQHLLLSILAIFAPAQDMILAAGALLIMDLITGIIAARKRKEPITSSGLRRSISKLFIYEIALCVAFVSQHYLMHDSIQIASIVAGYIGITESLSILENLNTASGNDLLKALMEKLNSANVKKD